MKPTLRPTVVPTVKPTSQFSIAPTVKPSIVPTVKPSIVPTVKPSIVPTVKPSIVPTVKPSIVPTVKPSIVPTVKPSIVPTVKPSIVPTVKPSIVPTVKPSIVPTVKPSIVPTVKPSIVPTETPTYIKTSTTLYYHGGPLMLGTITTHQIYHNIPLGDPVQVIIDRFLTDYDGSIINAINTVYYSTSVDGVKTYVKNSVIKGSNVYTTSYSTLSQLEIETNIILQINSGTLPLDENAVYGYYFRGSDSIYPDFGTKWCGYHSYMSVSDGKTRYMLKYMVIGDPTNNSNKNNCMAISSNTANGNAYGDAMVSIVYHEISEALTNPLLESGWFNDEGFENADVCAWQFGSYLDSNLNSNSIVGSRKYLIQQNLYIIPEKNYQICVNSLPS
jgi:hypothetical protein